VYSPRVRSMTGFGRGVAEHARTRATVDVRAVNHRFLDLKLRGAAVPPAVEEAISARVRTVIERGAVAISIHIANEGTTTRIDTAAAGAAHVRLSELARTLGVSGPDLALVLAQPGVVNGDTREEPDATSVLAALDGALAQLSAMRDAEGQALARELALRFDELTQLRAQLEKLASEMPALIQRRLHERLRRLVAEEVEPARLAQEVAMLADRADVTEEMVRLASHLDQGRALLAGAGAVGRRLDFLVQEIGRELNTIGSKSTLAEISSLVVDAKAVLEKVREQVQNVE